MRSIKVRVLVALITFTTGLLPSVLSGVGSRQPRQIVQPQRERALELDASPQAITFKMPPSPVSAWRDDYLSSDGVYVTYGCYEQGAPTLAAAKLGEALRGKRIVERRLKCNSLGEAVGERVVVEYPTAPLTEASGTNVDVLWAEGSKLFRIKAPSTRYALEFERSRAWAGSGCIDARPSVENWLCTKIGPPLCRIPQPVPAFKSKGQNRRPEPGRKERRHEGQNQRESRRVADAAGGPGEAVGGRSRTP
jgi:hypothetical protein